MYAYPQTHRHIDLECMTQPVGCFIFSCAGESNRCLQLPSHPPPPSSLGMVTSWDVALKQLDQKAWDERFPRQACWCWFN